MKKYNVAVLGATGMVGRTILKVLEEKNFPIETLSLFASKRSAGKAIKYAGQDIIIQELSDEAIASQPIDIALLAAGGTFSEHYAPLLKEQGALVIDNSSYWRMHDDIALIVPEVNGDNLSKGSIISNPNCSTIQSALPLKALSDAYGLKRVVYTTYQAVSGSGVKGVRDLKENVTENYPYSINNNILPHIDDFLDNGYTKEEMKMIEETRKILNLPNLKVSATTARVPLENTHAVAITIELEKPFNLDELKDHIAKFPGIVLMDDPQNNIYPLAEVAEGTDEVYVGRIRIDESVDNGIHLWCVADNIRKGAASNTVQIALKAIEGWES